MLHAEINRWFRNQPALYVTTLELQLEAANLAKLIAHNSALYRPQLRQLDQATVLRFGALAVNITKEGWAVLSVSSAHCQLMIEVRESRMERNRLFGHM